MARLTVVPVIPLALSEARKTAVSASSASVESRRVCVLLASASVNCSQVMPDASAYTPKASLILAVSGLPCGRRLATRMLCGASAADSLRTSASTATIAGRPTPRNEVPVRDGVEVAVMVTHDCYATILRAARRAVRKYDLVYVAIG